MNRNVTRALFGALLAGGVTFGGAAAATAAETPHTAIASVAPVASPVPHGRNTTDAGRAAATAATNDTPTQTGLSSEQTGPGDPFLLVTGVLLLAGAAALKLLEQR